MSTLHITVVDREGNKKTISITTPSIDPAKAEAFVDLFAGWTAAKVISWGESVGNVQSGDVFTAGDFDTVGHTANLRFVDETNKGFQFKIPAPVDTVLDDNEEVTAAIAQLVKTAINALVDGNVEYRGGRLITKEVSNPVTIPDLTAA